MRLLYLLLIVIIILLDQASKYFIVNHFALFEFYVVNDYFNIVRVHNTGAAFGLFSQFGGIQVYFLSTIALLVSVVIIFMLLFLNYNVLFNVSIACIASGAIGNTIDRFVYGYVVDFLDFHIQNYHYPSFNVADAAIFIGVCLFVLDHFKQKQ